MARLSLKIAYPIIIAGLFIIVSFIAVNYENFNGGFYFILVLLIIYIFLFGFAIGQNLSYPVKKLLKIADNLIRGDLKSRSYLENKDEIGELAMIFNRLADALEERRYENEKMERSVDMKVKAKTQALEETIDALEQKVKNRTFELQKMEHELERMRGARSVRAEGGAIKNNKKENNGRESAKEQDDKKENIVI